MLRCNDCGAEFYEPNTRRVSENLDGENGWWTYTVACCPRCGSQDLEEITEDEEEPED